MKKTLQIVLLSLVALCALPVSAVDICNDAIVDEGNYLSSGADQVQKAVQALVRNGADVRVRLLTNVPQSTLDFYKVDMLKGCQSWRSPDGGMKNNLVVVVVAPTKGKTGIYYGDLWRGKLTGKDLVIQTNSMNPRFRERNWSAGVLAGLNDIADFTSIRLAQAGGATTINHAVDLTGLWKVFRWIVLAVVAVSVLGLFWWLYSQWEARRSAQRDAQTKRGQCSGIINSFQNDVALATAKANQIADPERKELVLGYLQQARGHYANAASVFSGLDRSANNPDVSGLSVDEYRNMEARYQSVYETLQEAVAVLQRANDAVDQVKSGRSFQSPSASIKTSTVPSTEGHQPGIIPVGEQPADMSHHQTSPATSIIYAGDSSDHGNTLKQQARQRSAEAILDVTNLIETVERLIGGWLGCPHVFKQQLGTFRKERDELNRRLGEFELSEITLNTIERDADVLSGRLRRLKEDVENRKGDDEADDAPLFNADGNGGYSGYHNGNDITIIAPVIIEGCNEPQSGEYGQEDSWHAGDTEESPLSSRPVIVDDIVPDVSGDSGTSTDWGQSSGGEGVSTDFGKTSDGDGNETSWETGSTQY